MEAQHSDRGPLVVSGVLGGVFGGAGCFGVRRHRVVGGVDILGRAVQGQPRHRMGARLEGDVGLLLLAAALLCNTIRVELGGDLRGGPADLTDGHEGQSGVRAHRGGNMRGLGIGDVLQVLREPMRMRHAESAGSQCLEQRRRAAG